MEYLRVRYFELGNTYWCPCQLHSDDKAVWRGYISFSVQCVARESGTRELGELLSSIDTHGHVQVTSSVGATMTLKSSVCYHSAIVAMLLTSGTPRVTKGAGVPTSELIT